MIGQLVGQMALIQNLVQGQEELRAIIKKLYEDGCSRMKQTVEVGDQVIDQLSRRQEVGFVKSGLFKLLPHHRSNNNLAKNTGLIRVS